MHREDNMRKCRWCVIAAVAVLFQLYFPAHSAGQAEQGPHAPRGIIIGDKWNPETRELAVIFEEQDVLDLGEEGIRTVQLWSEIRDAAGKDVTWVVEYAGGLRQEVWTQKIRYDRFRTYLKKTFRRKLWDARAKKLVDVSGPCTVYLIEKDNPDKPVAVKRFLLK